jgi:hypothetical protein
MQIFGLYEAIARASGGTLNKDLQDEWELLPGGCRLREEF